MAEALALRASGVDARLLAPALAGGTSALAAGGVLGPKIEGAPVCFCQASQIRAWSSAVRVKNPATSRLGAKAITPDRG